MTNRLKISIERLYKVFSKYYGNSKMAGSPLYDDLDLWNQQLFSKKLRDLTAEDLSRFVGSVMLTWGDENDLKHFLPRILELTAEFKTPYDIGVLYSRFEDANWKTWPQEEQDAVSEFTISLWENLVNHDSQEAEWEFNEYFHAIANFYFDFSELLRIWEESNTFSSLKHLVNYIFNERQNIFDQSPTNLRPLKEFRVWLLSDKIIKKIEQAFYTYEKDDIAERISWVEKILSDERKYSA